ncbi:MAG TPA: carboxypeptidase-like regulatory domain-containing protein [Candidatus Limnocylindrales bacterium]|nr:carboxypeptidase-like regulatory domain-containing protein [Candidatus Limnocylindrales bacterium]
MTHPRTVARHSGAALALSVVLVALAVAACGDSGPRASVAPSGAPVTTPEEAVDAIRARTPWFDGIEARNPDLIGQAASWTAQTSEDGIRVTFEIGWGDCQAGCIERHTWTWDVATDGTATWVGEEGSEIVPDLASALAASGTRAGVGGRVTGGPTCPVERPGDPACAARLVAGAVLTAWDADGTEVARFTTDASGFYRIALPAGDYRLEARPVEGFMSGPAPQPFTVTDGALTALDLSYDTGIR